MTSTASAVGPAYGALLWLRALMLATVALLAGTTAHLSAHGLLPGPAALALLLLAGTAACAPLLRTAASTPRVVLLLVLGQAAVHAALTAVAGHRGDVVTGQAGHGPALWVEHLTEDLTAPHALMVLEHAAAAAVVGLWLACGERAVWALVRLATATFRRFARPPSCRPVHGPPRVVPVDPVLLPPTSPALAATVRLRGPPTGLPA